MGSGGYGVEGHVVFVTVGFGYAFRSLNSLFQVLLDVGLLFSGALYSSKVFLV